MKKSKIAKEINKCFDDYDLENVTAMIEFLKMQHECGLGLTKLVLENCKNHNFKKEEIFTIFKEAITIIISSMKNSSKEIINSGGCEVCED